MWKAKCSIVFSERAEVLATVSQHVHHVVVEGAGTEAVFDRKSSHLKSTVEIGFVGNVS